MTVKKNFRDEMEDSIGIRQLDLANHIRESILQNQMLRRLGRIHQDAYAKRVGVELPPEKEEDEDVLQVGDNVIHNHYGEKEESPSPPTPIPEPQPPTESPQNKQWWKWAVPLAVLAASPFVGWAAAKMADSPPDVDTRYRLEGDFEPVER
jgi:hypothetical protein